MSLCFFVRAFFILWTGALEPGSEEGAVMVLVCRVDT